MRGVRNGPVLVAVANDVMNGDPGDADWDVASARPRLSQAAPEDVAEAARRLTAARSPVILAGQGVLYAGATAELLELAELTGTPGRDDPERQERLPRRPSRSRSAPPRARGRRRSTRASRRPT